MTHPIGNHVKYFRREGKEVVCHDAIVIGQEHKLEGEEHPKLRLAFFEPKHESDLAGVNWSDAFEQAWSVPFHAATAAQAKAAFDAPPKPLAPLTPDPHAAPMRNSDGSLQNPPRHPDGSLRHPDQKL